MKKGTSLNNAIWIIGCKIFQSLLALVVTMLSARYLGPTGYGLINYAASITAFVLPIMQLGLRSTLVQEFVNNPDQEGEILGTALCMNILSAICCMIGISAFVSVANAGETDTLIVCALYSINLIFQALEMSQYWFQAKLLSKYTSLAMLFAYIVTSVYKIYLLAAGKSIYWFAIAQAIDFMIIAVTLLIMYRKIGEQKLSFSLKLGRKLLSKSRYYIVSSLMVTIFAQTDKIMLKLMMGDEVIGYYSAAVTCAGITGFVFSAIIDSMRPSVFESRKRSENAFEDNMKLLYSLIIYLSLAQCVFITLFSKLIVNVLYGSAYAATVPVLRIVVWYTTFSYMGPVRNIWILAEGKHSILWVINCSGAVMNVILNLVLIPWLGANGAAIASLLSQLFTNVIVGFILRPIRPNNALMLAALNPKFIVRQVQKLVKRGG